MDNSIQLFRKCGLVGVNVNYSEVANAFLTTGYTSNAGNTYFNSIRFAEGIIIKEDVGHGYKYTFLNGVKIYSVTDKRIIADRSFDCCVYNKIFVRDIAKDMLLDVLKDAAISMRCSYNEREAIVIVDNLLRKAFSEDQRMVLENQVKKYLA